MVSIIGSGGNNRWRMYGILVMVMVILVVVA